MDCIIEIGSAAQNFYFELSNAIEDAHSKEMITALFQKLIGDSVKNYSVEPCNDGFEFRVVLEKPLETVLERKTLQVPETLHFNVCRNSSETYIQFDEDGNGAPCTQNLNSSIIKSQFTWWEVHVDKDEFTLYRPHWFGPLYPFAGGTPVLTKLHRSELTSSD